MVDLLFNALYENASSKTRRYFLQTDRGQRNICDYLTTIQALLNADYYDSVEAHNGAMYDQDDYSVFGNVDELWSASRIYPSKKDRDRKSNLLLSANVEGVHTQVQFKDKDGTVIETYFGKILSPLEMNLIVDDYNADQKDGAKLEVTKLSGVKGSDFYSLCGFVDGNSIVEGNVTGDYDANVSVCLQYQNPLGTASVIDEVNAKAVERWLLFKKSTK